MKVNSIAALRHLLANMEKDLGLHELSSAQRDILYAASLLAQEEKPITVANLSEHPLVKDMARATFFRGLKSLSEHGYLRAGSSRSDGYRLTASA